MYRKINNIPAQSKKISNARQRETSFTKWRHLKISSIHISKKSARKKAESLRNASRASHKRSTSFATAH